MPYLNVKVSVTPSAEITRKAAAFLTDLTAEILGKKKELTSVTLEYVPPDAWFIGGLPVLATRGATFYLDIKITEGTNTKNEKADYIAKVFAAFDDLIGPLNPASYIVLHEARADAWGYAGRTQEFRYIQRELL